MKSGFVGLIGRPNAGKSTLLNALVKQKLAIISSKAQTTRNAIRGVLTDDEAQIIFIDTPGIHKPIHELGRQMNKEAYSTMSSVDIIYFLVDASKEFGSGDQYILDMIKQQHLPVFLILTKVDLLQEDKVRELLLKYTSLYDFKEVIPVSAVDNFNVEELVKTTKNYLEDGIMYYPKDQVCDYPEQFIIAELIREKILYLTNEEVPHSIAVVIERMGRKKGKLLINALILVDRDSQKGIIIGKQGSMIKQIGMMAREDIEGILGESIYLELFVRVEKDWRNKKSKLLQLGYIQIDEI